MISAEHVFRADDNVVYRRVAGEGLLVPIRGRLADMQQIFALEAVSDLAWQQIDGNRTVHAVAELITHEFDVSLDIALADLGPFLEQLLSEGLISEVA